MDARAQSAVSDLQAATDALTLSRQRYLGRLSEPRFATVPGLLRQLAEAVERSGETGAISSANPARAPLDLAPVDLFREIDRGARGRVVVAELRPRRLDIRCLCRCGAPAAQCETFRTYGLACCRWCAHSAPDPVAPVAGNLRQLAAHARTLARTDYLAVSSLADQVCNWRERVEQLLPEDRTARDLPDLTCSRCKRNRIPDEQPDGRRLLVPALQFVKTPMPGIVCRGCGHLYQGDGALRALAAWQGSQRAGAA